MNSLRLRLGNIVSDSCLYDGEMMQDVGWVNWGRLADKQRIRCQRPKGTLTPTDTDL